MATALVSGFHDAPAEGLPDGTSVLVFVTRRDQQGWRAVAATNVTEAASPVPTSHRRAGERADRLTRCGHVLTRTGDDRCQVEPVPRTFAGVVRFESGHTPLDEPASSDAVTAGGMRETDTDLGKTLPQIAFFAWASLPAGLKDLVCSKRSALMHQGPGHVQGLRRR